MRQRLRESETGSATELDGDERLTRFLYSRSQYSPKADKPKPSAFNQAPYDELSTAHITGLTDEAVWELSKSALGSHTGRDKIYARGDLEVAEVLKQRLKAIRDDEPFARHAVIVGWPQLSDAAERKERWLQIALDLSQAATLNVRATPVTAGE